MDGSLNEMPEDARKSMQQYEGDIEGPLVDYTKKGHKVELSGSEKVDNEDAFKLKVTLSNGSVMYYLIDKKTNFVTKIIRTAKTPNGDLEIIATLKDYRMVNGINISFEQSIEQGPMGTLMAKVTKVEHNIEISDSFFEIPKN